MGGASDAPRRVALVRGGAAGRRLGDFWRFAGGFWRQLWRYERDVFFDCQRSRAKSYGVSEDITYAGGSSGGGLLGGEFVGLFFGAALFLELFQFAHGGVEEFFQAAALEGDGIEKALLQFDRELLGVDEVFVAIGAVLEPDGSDHGFELVVFGGAAGCHSSAKMSHIYLYSAGSSPVMRKDLARSPQVRAFMRTAALPSSVLGPVECCALRIFASCCLSETNIGCTFPISV